jgi:hypothetical protein
MFDASQKEYQLAEREKMVTKQFRMPRKLLADLEEMSSAEGLSVTAYVRRICTLHVRHVHLQRAIERSGGFPDDFSDLLRSAAGRDSAKNLENANSPEEAKMPEAAEGAKGEEKS